VPHSRVPRLEDLLNDSLSRCRRLMPQLCGQSRRNLSPMEATIFDEDLAGSHPGHDDTCQVDSGDIALQGLPVAQRQPILALELHPQPLQESEIGMVS